MTKSLALLFLVLTSLNAHAITWKVFGACSDKPVFQGTYDADLAKSAGHLTIEILEKNKIPYQGVPQGINSINNSAVDDAAIEVVSDKEMRVYGWCFAVNGKIPPAMADKVQLEDQSDTLVWFYAYSTNLENQWVDMCNPAYWVKSKQFCK